MILPTAMAYGTGLNRPVAVLVPDGQTFLARICSVPVKASKATRSLGCYYSRGSEPRCIRLQFVQEPDALWQTFLHEVAHLCDHLLSFHKARSIGAGTARIGNTGLMPSKFLLSVVATARLWQKLHQERLKVVARVANAVNSRSIVSARLPSRRQYLHAGCGGRLRPV